MSKPPRARAVLTLVCTGVGGQKHKRTRLAQIALDPYGDGVPVFGVVARAPAQGGRDGSVRFHPGEKAPDGRERWRLRCPRCSLDMVLREDTGRALLERLGAGARVAEVDVAASGTLAE